MSQLVGGALPQFILQRKDRRLVPTYGVIRRERDRIVDRDLPTAYPGGYSTAFWPGGRGFIGDQGADVGLQEAVYSRPMARLAWGNASRVGFVGTTRDAYGTPIGGVTCSLFRTADRLFIMDIVSDANGDFLLQSWYSPDTHFIVFYKAGAPSIYGTTDQTLIGA
jgi:hypothetical protein